MRHRKDHRKLGRSPSHRKAMLRNMVTSLLEHEQIRTTDAKAKELRGIADRMITLGKRGTLHARRQALETQLNEASKQLAANTIVERACLKLFMSGAPLFCVADLQAYT